MRKHGNLVFEKSQIKPEAIAAARQKLHLDLASDVFVLRGSDRVPIVADKSNMVSVRIAAELARTLNAGPKLRSRSADFHCNAFRRHCLAFLKATFPLLYGIRPGMWHIEPNKSIAEFEQYGHFRKLDRLLQQRPTLRSVFGGNNLTRPDIVIGRQPESDFVLHANARVVDSNSVPHESHRRSNGGAPLLHASVSCKLTFCPGSPRTKLPEVLNLIRNRKGHMPHVVAVTAEPLPSRLASLCLGTGDLNCVYHVALPELQTAITHCKYEDALGTLRELIDGRRLKDISDLPLDLAV